MWDNVQNDLLTSICQIFSLPLVTSPVHVFLEAYTSITFLPPTYMVSVVTYILYLKQDNVIMYCKIWLLGTYGY